MNIETYLRLVSFISFGAALIVVFVKIMIEIALWNTDYEDLELDDDSVSIWLDRKKGGEK